MELRPPDPPLREADFALRPWRLEDAQAIAAACQDPEIGRWTRIPSPYAEDDARAFLSEVIQGWQAGTGASFAIVDPQTDVLLGSIALHLIGDGRAGTGYWMAAEARGRGIATHALKRISRWALEELGIERLELITDPENTPSQKVAERAGYAREGVLRGYITVKGKRRDCVMFSLLADD